MITSANLAAATLSDSVQKVHAFLQQSGVPCQFKPLAESTRTIRASGASAASRAIGTAAMNEISRQLPGAKPGMTPP